MTPDPNTDDDEIVTWWGLVIEGYLATQDKLMGEIADRFGLAPASFDILLRLVRSPEHRMPMTRLATEAALSSGGFTKVEIATVQQRSRAPDAHHAAVAYCQGTPLRAEIEAQGSDALARATEVATQALVQRYGAGPIEGSIQAIVATARKH